ncbi:MAG: roadblock/LC7 domain-containing protein [Desulfobacter sp.]
MGVERLFSVVSRIKGVYGYIVVDGNGAFMAGDVDAPERLLKTISACGRRLVTLGHENFKYVLFSRKNKGSILIFPARGFFLGVVTQTHARDSETATAVMAFLRVVEGKPR